MPSISIATPEWLMIREYPTLVAKRVTMSRITVISSESQSPVTGMS